MSDIRNIIIAILLLVVTLCLVFGGRGYRYYEDKLQQEKQKKSVYALKLESQLLESEQARLVLARTADSLHRANEVLDSRIKDTDKQLREIKGRYDKRSNRELERDMNEKYQEYQ
jgi:hypothetical protein